MNVLSVFDGMSCGRIALDRSGIEYTNYYASEIDRYAIQIAQKNYPDTIQLGNVMQWKTWRLPKPIHLLLGGSPCQGFSFAGKQLNFNDPRSTLFFEYVDILGFIRLNNPGVKFLLENVQMKKAYRDIISSYLGVEPIKINSALVSAQNRERLYWTNIEGIAQPEDKNILLKDIILDDVYPVELDGLRGKKGGFGEGYVRVYLDKSTTLRTPSGGGKPSLVMKSLIHTEKAIEYMKRETKDGRTHWDFKHHSDIRNPKSAAVVANFFKGVPYNVLKSWDCIRKFHPIECERLQTVPDNYTEGVSNTQRYKMLGNGWTVDIITHILNFL
jgi:DNA (cytosine-5)-methyltransferase 3A